MQKLENNTLQNFLERFIDTLKDENENNFDLGEENNDLDIPFIVSSLYQSFKNDTSDYTEFISDLEHYPDYEICVEESRNDYSGIIDAYIYLSEYKSDDEEDMPNYDYLLSFTYDFRDYGYCECTPDMEGKKQIK